MVEAAIEIFFTSGLSSGIAAAPAAPAANMRSLEALYQRYKDPHGDMILAEGVGKFCEDLRVRRLPWLPQPALAHIACVL